MFYVFFLRVRRMGGNYLLCLFCRGKSKFLDYGCGSPAGDPWGAENRSVRDVDHHPGLELMLAVGVNSGPSGIILKIRRLCVTIIEDKYMYLAAPEGGVMGPGFAPAPPKAGLKAP